MVKDLKNGDFDAVVLPHPIAVYLASQDCDLEVVGDIFVWDYYGIAFPNQQDQDFITEVSKANARLN